MNWIATTNRETNNETWGESKGSKWKQRDPSKQRREKPTKNPLQRDQSTHFCEKVSNKRSPN